MDSHHGEVVALLGVTDEGVHGIGHDGDELLGFVLLLVQCIYRRLFSALEREEFVRRILRFGQTVRIEENSRAGINERLLLRIVEIRVHATSIGASWPALQ